MSKKSTKNITPDILDDGVVKGSENIVVAEQAPATQINDIPADIVAGLLKRGLTIEFIHTLDLKKVEAIGLTRKSDSVKKWKNGEGPLSSKVKKSEKPVIEVETMTKTNEIAKLANTMEKFMTVVGSKMSEMESKISANQGGFIEVPSTEIELVNNTPEFVLPEVPKKSAPAVKSAPAAKKLVYVKHYTFQPSSGKQKGQDIETSVMSIRGFEVPKEGNYYGYMPFVYKKATVAALNEDLETFGEAEFLRRLKALKLHIS